MWWCGIFIGRLGGSNGPFRPELFAESPAVTDFSGFWTSFAQVVISSASLGTTVIFKKSLATFYDAFEAMAGPADSPFWPRRGEASAPLWVPRGEGSFRATCCSPCTAGQQIYRKTTPPGTSTIEHVCFLFASCPLLDIALLKMQLCSLLGK